MDKHIKVDLEYLLLIEGLKINRLKENFEIEIDNALNLISINKIPFFKTNLKEENGLILGKIQKIFDKDEALTIKEKYLI